MRITERDLKVVRDVALSHLLSRDQLIQLGYFGSVTRLNHRVKSLVERRLLKRLTTPFFGQSLYSAGPLAAEVAGERVAPILAERSESPRFVQHALSVTNVRIALLAKGAKGWRFEQQLWRTVGTRCLKPDGLVLTNGVPAFVEVDLGHVAPAKFKDKLKAYSALAQADLCSSLYGFPNFRLLVVTTSSSRSRLLRSLLPDDAGFDFLVQTFEELGAARLASWS